MASAAKKILRDNVGSDGSINNDGFARAILQYRNTPIQGINASPAQLLFCRDLRDFIPSHPKHYKLNKKWVDLAYQREKQLSARNEKLAKSYDEHAHNLKPLDMGTNVFVQNKHDKRHFNKWNLSGRIVEVMPHRQYKIRLDGSGRISLRNRKHIKPMPIDLITKDTPFLKPTVCHPIQANVPKAGPISSGSDSTTDSTLRNENSSDGTQQRRLKNAMKKLASFNAPGLQETPLNITRRYRHMP